jgi:hypothetical protein
MSESQACRIRIVAFAACLIGAAWIVASSVGFRASLRTQLERTYSRIYERGPAPPNDTSKIINSYYEALYRDLPATIVPALLIAFGAAVLFVLPKQKSAVPSK